jgi:hypothetical protein
VRSAPINTKMLNDGKLRKLIDIYNVGRQITEKYLGRIWPMNTGKYAGSVLYGVGKGSNVSARFKQLCCKKALDIKRSVKEKVAKLIFIKDRIMEEIKAGKTSFVIKKR